MTISIELFLLDNMMMNYLTLRMAGALYGGRTHQIRVLLAAAGGAGYALMAMTIAPFLNAMPCKLLLCAAMALPLAVPLKLYLKALFCLMLSACLMGGVMLGMTTLFGGGFRNGAYLCTVPVRVVLMMAVVGLLLPRCVMAILHAVKTRSGRARLLVQLTDRTLELTAMIDSGNLLQEPLTGLPVIVVRPGLLPEEGGLPVPYRTIDGEGILHALHPKRIGIWQSGSWRELDALVASSPTPMCAADAIIGSEIWTAERWVANEENTEFTGANLQMDTREAAQGDPLHSYGGDAAAAVPGAGGTGMDRETHAG